MEARGRQEVDRLAAIGLAEEHRAATAVDSAFRDPVAKSIDEIISVHIERIAESPEVRQMIREESTTLLEDLLDQVRDRASRADDRAERAARRMFRRGRPRPDTDAGAPAALAFGAESAASIAAPATPADTTTLADQPFAGPAIASPAGFVSRVIALALDIWVLAVSVGAAGFILFAVIGAFRPVASGIDLRAAVPAAMGALVTVLYFIVCWAAFGRTLGMALMGLKGLTWDGKRVSLLRAVLRYVGYLISVCFVCVGLLWVLFDNRRLGWHDHLARTRVIHVPRMIGHATSPASRSPAPAAADGP